MIKLSLIENKYNLLNKHKTYGVTLERSKCLWWKNLGTAGVQHNGAGLILT